jgi:hypothetical protein
MKLLNMPIFDLFLYSFGRLNMTRKTSTGLGSCRLVRPFLIAYGNQAGAAPPGVTPFLWF